jgi:glycosyltransferase involved in cell wall biosynthesis
MSYKKIFIWSPFTSKVGTVNNVLNGAFSLIKFSKYKNLDIRFINTFGEWDNFKENLYNKNIKLLDFKSVKFIKNYKKEGFIKSRFYYCLIFIFSISPLIKIIKKEKPDFFFAYLITSLPLLLFSLFKFETKLILCIAGHPKINFFRKYLWKKVSKKIFAVTCPSEELKINLIKQRIFDEDKIFVIQDPHLNINNINKLKNKQITDEFFDHNKILISIGRLTKQKNFDFLIKNFKIIKSQYTNLKLIIIGDGEDKIYLKKLINELNMEEDVKIVGHKDNIYNYLINSDYFISTSNWEGSSLAMIDAAYIGLPILCSDCPSGRKEFIDNDKRGYLYLSNNEKDFHDKFIKMFNQDKKTLKLKLIESKKETKKYTFFHYFLRLNNIISNF